MLRETQFLIGGAIVIVAGVGFLAALVWSGAGLLFFGAYLGAGLAVGFGAFFLYVGRAEGADRRAYLAREAPEGAAPPAGRPPR